MDVADGLGVFMFMHAILPQEWLQVLIDNTVDTIDFLDGHALDRQTMHLKEQGLEAVRNLGPRPSESRTEQQQALHRRCDQLR
jgi:hypothetical protein